MKTNLRSVLTLLAFLCLQAAGPQVQAVVPPPDGGYPGFTTAEGQKALFSLTTGSANTAVGWYSLFSDTEGSFNTATGAGTLLFNTAGSNTAFGAAALLFNTTGEDNTAVGTAALLNNANGIVNTAVGSGALRDNTDGNFNTAVGQQALTRNTSGQENTAVGFAALANHPPGNFNTAVGVSALLNTTGIENTAVGAHALQNSTGSSNIALGFNAGGGVTTANGVICIDRLGANVDNTTWINHVYGVTTQSGMTAPVIVSNTGQLGTVSSSRRFKHDIRPMENASEAILELKPVIFHYKSDETNTPQFGLIAEEVAAVNPDLVMPDENGNIYSVRYEQINAMLLNEFLKEHRKVEKLEATVADLAEQLQKITAQMQMKNSSARVAGK
jgi:Chaperone of endosialidase